MSDFATEFEKIKAELDALRLENEALKKALAPPPAPVAPAPSDNPYQMLKGIGQTLYNTQIASDIWRGTPLEAINELKPDFAGKVGEEFIRQLCVASGIANESTGDVNSKDGTYDQKIGASLKKTEIKTARLGGGKYQHETLKSSGYDYILFVDIHPQGGYLTVVSPFAMDSKHPITGTRPSLRKGTTDVYKWDFAENHLNKFITAGMCLKFDKTTPLTTIADFLRAKIV